MLTGRVNSVVYGIRFPTRYLGLRLLSTNSQESNKDDSWHLPPPKRLSLARPIEQMILRSKITKDIDTARFIGKTVAITAYSFAGVTLLGTFGVDTKPIIAGIGVTGFTVGFALKEIAANFLSGILLMFNRPFQKGQYLKVLGGGSNLEGEVESIDSRYVLLKSKDKAMIMIPSVVVYSNPILVMPKAPSDSKKSA